MGVSVSIVTHQSARHLDACLAGVRDQGAAVCEVLVAAPREHLRAADIAQRAGTPMDLSTVYRTLDTLEEHGLVEHVHLGHGATW